MSYRYWFLVAAAGVFGFSYVSRYIPFWINYGDSEVRSSMLGAIACLGAFVALEIAHHALRARPMHCGCGYPIHGLKCPECGHPVGGRGPGR